MGHPLNSLASRHSHAFRNLKNDQPGRVNLPVGKHNIEETLTLHKQATGTHQKNSEQNAPYLLPIPASGTQRTLSKQPAAHQKNSEQNAPYLLPIFTICTLTITLLLLLFFRLVFNLTRSYEQPAKEREQEAGGKYETERPKTKEPKDSHWIATIHQSKAQY